MGNPIQAHFNELFHIRKGSENICRNIIITRHHSKRRSKTFFERRDWMVKNKAALIGSAVILCICRSLFYPYPNNELLEARSVFMSFPIRNQDGYVALGIMGSVLFIIAMVLLVIGLKKHHLLAIVIVSITYSLLPNMINTVYQETLASGIMAISYDGDGTCRFEYMSDDLLNGECSLTLQNRSNEEVSFELEFLDSYFTDDEVRMESLMNVAGPYRITIEANHKESIQLKELLDLSDVPNHIDGGTSNAIHFRLMDGDIKRSL